MIYVAKGSEDDCGRVRSHDAEMVKELAVSAG
jgi:hypothetical protein